MRDLTPKAYDLDCTGNPACWPWVVAPVIAPTRREVVDAAMAAAEAEEAAPRTLPTGRIDDVVVFCTAFDCDRVAAQVRKATPHAFADLCEYHRALGRQRVHAGGDPSYVALRLRMGVRRGRPRSAA